MARSGSDQSVGKKSTRVPVTGINLLEALSDAAIFIASQGFVGGLRMLFQGKLVDGARALLSNPDQPFKADEFDKILGLVRKHVGEIYPATDRPKVERAVEVFLLKAVDLYGNGSLSSESRRLAFESLKTALAQDLRAIQAAHTTFQTRVFEMLDAPAKAAAMVWFSRLSTEQRVRWSKIQERIESPEVFASALTVSVPTGPDDAKWREQVLTTLEILTEKPEVPKGKSMFDQIGDIINSPTLAKLFVGRKPLPARETVVDFSAPPPDYRRPETNDEYRTRLIGLGVIKPDDNFAALLYEDKKHAAKARTLELIDAEDDAIMRLSRGEFKDK